VVLWREDNNMNYLLLNELQQVLFTSQAIPHGFGNIWRTSYQQIAQSACPSTLFTPKENKLPHT
jgi:hypothetical protein